MGLRFNTLMQAIIAGGIYTPPVSIYGAPADAGQINTSDSIAGTRYYLDAVNGLDANVGTSPGAGNAFQTLAKEYTYTAIGGAPAVADSAFMLKRGDTYNGFLMLKKVALTTSKYLTGAYGTGARPKINYVNSAAQHNQSIGIVYSGYTGTGASEGVRLRNLSMGANFVSQVHPAVIVGSAPTNGMTITGGTTGTTGTFQYNDAGYYIVSLTAFGSTGLGFSNGEAITWSGGSSTVSGGPNQANAIWLCSTPTTGGINWEVSNCDISSAAGMGVLIGYDQTAGSANSFTIKNTTIYDCARAINNGAGIDGGGAGTAVNTPVGQASLIESNTVYDCGIATYTTNHNIYVANLYDTTIRKNWSYMTQNRGNYGLVIHGMCGNVLIEQNLIEKCCNGIGINPGYGTAEVFDSFTIRKNIIRRQAFWAGQTQGYSCILASLTNSQIYNNLWYGNGYCFQLQGGGAPAAVTNAVTISHETIYNCTSSAGATGNEAQMLITGTMTNVVIQNCIIANTGTSHYLLWVDAAALSGVTLRNCQFWSPNYTGNVIHWGAMDYTLANWMTSFGNALGCKVGDPLFTNAAGDDFTLRAGSPCKLAGYNSGITTDFADNARHATTPSIGAYE